MTTALNARTILIITALLISFMMIATSALAVRPVGNTRPGWGFGDTNHIHTGPPGQSVNPSNTTTIIQNNSANVSNNVNASSNTGGNVSTGGSITTGPSNIFINISNTLGFNEL